MAGVAAGRYWLPSNGKTTILTAVAGGPTVPGALPALLAVLLAPLLALAALAVRARVATGTARAIKGGDKNKHNARHVS